MIQDRALVTTADQYKVVYRVGQIKRGHPGQLTFLLIIIIIIIIIKRILLKCHK